MSTEGTVGSIVQILDLVLELNNAASAIGFSFAEVAAMQHQAQSEGRDLDVEDFRKLHDGVRGKLDALGKALAMAEDEPAPIAKPVEAKVVEELVEDRSRPALVEEDPGISPEQLQVILGTE